MNVITCSNKSSRHTIEFNKKKFKKKELSKKVRKFESFSFNSKTPLLDRIKTPPPFILSFIRKMDGRNYTSYKPSKKEIQIINKSFSLLPPLMLKYIKERVIEIYFINDLWGSGMTDWLVDKNGKIFCVMYFNPMTLKKNMSEWLTYKERTCFKKDHKDTLISIRGGVKYSGFLGILLHEGTHVIDYCKNITDYVEANTLRVRKYFNKKILITPFTKKIWQSIYKPSSKYDFPIRKKITFYGFSKGPKLKLSEAPTAYEQLSKTPFVSLYGGLSWAEELAELALFYHITKVLKQPYVIELKKNKQIVFSYEPGKSPAVKKRFLYIKQFYQ